MKCDIWTNPDVTREVSRKLIRVRDIIVDINVGMIRLVNLVDYLKKENIFDEKIASKILENAKNFVISPRMSEWISLEEMLSFKGNFSTRSVEKLIQSRVTLVEISRSSDEMDFLIDDLKNMGAIDDDLVGRIKEFLKASVSNPMDEEKNKERLFALWDEFMKRYGISVFPGA